MQKLRIWAGSVDAGWGAFASEIAGMNLASL